MDSKIYILAITIGFIHTICGPDHYIPFIMLSKARNWKLPKALWITACCGAGHIAGSIIIGLIGAACGEALSRLEIIEAARGELAAWGLITFGAIYCAWGIKQAFREKKHAHCHLHANGIEHTHTHDHTGAHFHAHQDNKKSAAFWTLFAIFVFGPCEPLIPLIIYPAAEHSASGAIIVALLFGFTTISAMLLAVTAGIIGINLLPLKKIDKFTHAIAGFTITVSGLAIVFLGL